MIWILLGLWLVLQVPIAMFAGRFMGMQYEPGKSTVDLKENAHGDEPTSI